MTTVLAGAVNRGRKIHYLPQYRADNIIKLEKLLSIPNAEIADNVSVELIKAVVAQRSIKSDEEIAEIEASLDICYEMHTTAMKTARPEMYEHVISGGVNFDVFGRRFDCTGSPLGPEFQINTTTQNDIVRPRIAMNSTGNSVVVWISSNKVMAQRFDHLGNIIGPEFEAYTDSVYSQFSPSVSNDSDGNFAIAWLCQYSGWPQNSTTVLCKRFDSGAVPIGPHFEVNDAGFSSTENICELSMNNSGEFVVVWEEFYDRMFQRYDESGNPVGGNVQMDTDMDGTVPTIAMNDTGNFVIAWITRHDDGSEMGIAAQRYDNTGAEVGSDFQVNTYTYLNQQYPAVAMDNEGRFTVVWQSQQEDTIGSWDSMGIYGQQYDATGAAVGGEMHVNTYEDGRQDTPRIAVAGGDRFVVVWDSGPMSGSVHSGIYAQLYGPDLTGTKSPPSAATLSQNFPNPFNPSTTVLFSLNQTDIVTLKIFNINGDHVRTLVDRRMESGSYSKEWNGKNDAGCAVATGVYFYRLHTGNSVLTRKMVLLK